jgi:hypothetical protein
MWSAGPALRILKLLVSRLKDGEHLGVIALLPMRNANLATHGGNSDGIEDDGQPVRIRDEGSRFGGKVE